MSGANHIVMLLAHNPNFKDFDHQVSDPLGLDDRLDVRVGEIKNDRTFTFPLNKEEESKTFIINPPVGYHSDVNLQFWKNSTFTKWYETRFFKLQNGQSISVDHVRLAMLGAASAADPTVYIRSIQLIDHHQEHKDYEIKYLDDDNKVMIAQVPMTVFVRHPFLMRLNWAQAVDDNGLRTSDSEGSYNFGDNDRIDQIISIDVLNVFMNDEQIDQTNVSAVGIKSFRFVRNRDKLVNGHFISIFEQIM